MSLSESADFFYQQILVVAQEILMAITSPQKWIHPTGCRALLYSGPSLTTKKHNTKHILHPPWHWLSPLITTHFIPFLNILIKKSNRQKIQEHAPSEWDIGHFYFLGAASQKKTPQNQGHITSTMASAIASYDQPFYSNFDYFINKSNHQKIQEHAPSEWDVGLGKHLQCCSIVPSPTHRALRLTCTILKLSFSKVERSSPNLVAI